MADVQEITTPQTGWDRIKKFYNSKEICMERELVIKSVRISFMGTFLLGGFYGRPEANKRVQMHTTGVTFASPSLRVTRILDYKILSFLRNGFRWGFRGTVLIGSITMAMTHLTLYRDRFSAWYAPTISGAFSFIGHNKASATAIIGLPLGISGCLQAMALGTLAGCSISSIAGLYSLYLDSSVDYAYKKFRTDCEQELKELEDHQAKISEIMKREKITFSFQAEKYLKRQEEEKQLGSLDDFDDPIENSVDSSKK